MDTAGDQPIGRESKSRSELFDSRSNHTVLSLNSAVAGALARRQLHVYALLLREVAVVPDSKCLADAMREWHMIVFVCTEEPLMMAQIDASKARLRARVCWSLHRF